MEAPGAEHRRLSPYGKLIANFEQAAPEDGGSDQLYQLGQLEERTAFVVAPWWKPPGHFIKTREDARAFEAELSKEPLLRPVPSTLTIYTDGSGINGKIGAAAVAPTIGREASALLGPTTHFTVYTGELYGILMAIGITLRHWTTNPYLKRIVCFVDNQAAISAVAAPRHQPGQYLLRHIIEGIEALRLRGVETELH